MWVCRTRRNTGVVAVFRCVLLTAGAWTLGCGGGGVSPVAPPPPPPPPTITVTVSPPSGAVLLGATQSFTATVSNTTNTGVTWAVNGIAGGNSSVGTIISMGNGAGLYTAPRDLPVLPNVTVTATSAADSSRSGGAQIGITSDIAVNFLSPSASVELGGLWDFLASISSAGNPDRTILYTHSRGRGAAARRAEQPAGTSARSRAGWGQETNHGRRRKGQNDPRCHPKQARGILA